MKLTKLIRTPALLAIICLLASSLPLVAQPIDSLKALVGIAKHDTTVVSLYTQIADEFYEQKQNDSALFYYNLALTKVKSPLTQYQTPDLYFKINQLFFKIGSFSTSIEYLFKILTYYDDIRNTEHDTLMINLKVADTYASLGSSYFALSNYSKSLEAFENGYEILKTTNPDYKFFEQSKQMFGYLVNMGSVTMSLNRFDIARNHFEEALGLSKMIGNIEYDGFLYNSLGIIFKEENNFSKAKEYYNKSLEIRELLRDTAGLAQVHNNLGNLEYLQGNYDTAIAHLQKAMEYNHITGNIHSELYSVLFLSNTYERLGEYKNSLNLFQRYNALNDSIRKSEQQEQTVQIELQYLNERQRKELEHKQQIELAKKERKVLTYMIFSGLFLFSAIILYLINRNQSIRMKQVELAHERLELEQHNLTLEKHNLRLENEKLAMTLEHRNKELATNVMYLIQKNEYITKTTQELIGLKDNLLPKNRTLVQKIIRNLRINTDDSVWQEFEIRFQNVHKDFYKKLHDQFPNLTPSETRLCAFLKLNMSTKEISSITHQTPESLHVARSRLRKKLGISRDDNLVAFLQEI